MCKVSILLLLVVCGALFGYSGDDFETGFIDPDYSLTGNADWFITTSSYDGSYAIESGDITDYQSSTISIEVSGASDVSFWYYVSSEECCDKLRFYVDDVEISAWGSSVYWTQYYYGLDSSTTHTLKWVYSKDSSVSNGEDCARLDNIYVTTSGGSGGSSIITDDFETGFIDPDYSLTGNADWFITFSSYQGSYAIESGDINDYQNSTITLEVSDTSDVSFWYYVSSEGCCDKLKFYIDDVEMNAWGGTVYWTEYSAQLDSSTTHTLKWVYEKDSSVSSGEDCARLDNITFTTSSTPQYTVTFDAGDYGTIISGDAVQSVDEGSSATEPTVDANVGWIFTGWDIAFDNVTADITVTAQYQTGHVVTFDAGSNGSITSGNAVQTVADGDSAISPTVSPNSGYTFEGWDVSFDNVTSDITVTAQYSIILCTVTFDAGDHGTITSGDAVQVVEYGSSAVEPEITDASGYVFSGWNNPFGYVTGDVHVTAEYLVVPEGSYVVRFVTTYKGFISSGSELQVVEGGSSAAEPEVTALPVYCFTGWDTDFSNVTSDLTITAQYFEWLGNGTEADPYRISTVAHLEGVNTKLSSSFILMNDIDLSGRVYDKAVIAYDTDSADNFQGTYFTGTFDGAGHKITGLTINAPDQWFVGLFGYVYSGADIDDLAVTSCNISGYSYTGALAGKNGGYVTGCYSTGTVYAPKSYLGGLVGDNTGRLTNCYSSVTVNSTTDNITVFANYIGGLAGHNSYRVTECYATGSITMQDQTSFVGGLVGLNDLVVERSYATGLVEGEQEVGGLVGTNGVSGSITDCYARGAVTAHYTGGGLVGRNWASIENCYSTGTISSVTSGGLLGWNSGGTVTSSYWDTQSSGTSSSEGGTGKTTSQMQTQSTYSDWDFSTVWTMDGYPILDSSSCTVTFNVGAHGYFTGGSSQQTIPMCSSATAPLVSPYVGWIFTGWDKQFGIVTSDITVTALYSIITYTVTFDAGDHGSIASGEVVQTIGHGYEATAPVITADVGWLFTAWDTAFDSVTNDMTVTAQYTAGPVVTFNAGDHGSITAGDTVQTVLSGSAAVAPTITPQEGYEFTDWDVSFDNVTSDITVTAQYSIITYQVTFVAGSHGTITSGNAIQTIDHGSSAIEPTVTENPGAHFTGWDAAFDNVTSDLTVTAQYTIDSFTVTFLPGPYGTITAGDAVQTIFYGSAASAPTVTPQEGYNFTGWDIAYDNVTSDLTVNAQYAGIVYYTVTFDAGDNGLITAGDAVQQIEEGDSATAPTVTPNSGYIFNGWDVSFENVSANITVTALYEQWVGDGTAENPYRISTRAHLEAVNNDLAAHYIVVSDIDLSGHTYYKAVIAWDVNSDDQYDGTPFTGVLNGARHSITGLTISASSNTDRFIGLFGGIDGGQVGNLNLLDCDITGYKYNGFIAGQSTEGNISNCYTSGTIHAGDSNNGGIVGKNTGGAITCCSSNCTIIGGGYCGGIVGYNYLGIISRCCSTGTIDCLSYSGGFVGYHRNGSITDCFTTVDVTGQYFYLGGFVGLLDGPISRSYSTGAVVGGYQATGGFVGGTMAAVTNSFWDTEASGFTTSAGGTGRTTAQMKTQSTFTDAGWDFVGESDNGVEETWYMEPDGYPRLNGVAENHIMNVEQLIVAESRRIDRSVFEYDVAVKVKNLGDDIASAELNLIGFPANMRVLSANPITAASMLHGGQAICTGIITLEINRSVPTDTDKITWRVVTLPTIGGQNMETFTTDISFTTFAANGIGQAELYEIADSWLWPGLADASGDGIVNYEDMAILVGQQ